MTSGTEYAIAWIVCALSFGGATFHFSGNEAWGWGIGLFIIGVGAFASIMLSYLDTSKEKSPYDEVFGDGK